VLGGEEGVTSMKKTWIKVKAFIYEKRERERESELLLTNNRSKIAWHDNSEMKVYLNIEFQ
jgi:hypothetical protein